MVKRDTIFQSLYIGGGVVVFALTGVFGSFAELDVITGVVMLSSVLLGLSLGGTGYYTAARVREEGLGAMMLNGLVGSVVVAVLLAVLVLLIYDPSGAFRSGILFVFPNLTPSMFTILTFGGGLMPGLLYLLGLAVLLGVIAALLFVLPERIRRALLVALALTLVLGLMQEQLIKLIALPDALVLLVAFVLGYGASSVLSIDNVYLRGGVGLALGVVVGVVASTLIGSVLVPSDASVLLGLEPSTLQISALSLPVPVWLAVTITVGLTGLLGALVATSARGTNTSMNYLIAAMLLVAVMNWQDGMTITAAVIAFAILLALALLSPVLSESASQRRSVISRPQRQLTRTGVVLIVLALVMVAPSFLGQSLTYALAFVGLYVIMGIGLNIVVGYTGMLALGHVGFFAVGAYTVGLLTTPTIATCGVPASDIQVRDVAQVRETQALDITQTSGEAYFTLDAETSELVPLNCRIWNFWLAMPLAVALTGTAGVLLTIPVLRLRGDYLAIVTLGLAEIISIIVAASSFKHIFGSAQGIKNIPSPVIDLTFLNDSWRFTFFSGNIYYLVVPGILISVLISQRLLNSRIGRAWRSIRADEDVAEAMGINLVQAKLSAFGIGAAFAGLGGALFAAGLRGAFPNSFTLMVSVNVLSMVIIGGLGSIPGVIVGALMLVGLPEILREIKDYRLLVFGMLLVGTMLLKPDGLLPPGIRRLTDIAKATDDDASDSPQQVSSSVSATGD